MSAGPPLALAWCRFQPRTSALALALGGRGCFISGSRFANRGALLPLRYLSDARRTWRLLQQHNPGLVVAITPPVFAPLTAWLWCRLHRRLLVIDCHTDTFHSRKWRWALPLHRWLTHRARAVLLHTEEAEVLVRRWGSPAILLPDDLPEAREATAQPVGLLPRIVVAGALDAQEPVAEALDAAALLPGVEVRVTGDPNRIPPPVRRRVPANVVLTGYLPYGEFLGELLAADVVAAFSTDPHIMNRAAFEAVGLARALVLSDHAGLRARFGEAALYCTNKAAAMAQTLQRALDDRVRLAEESARAQARLRAQREEGLGQLRARLPGFHRADSKLPRRILMVTQHPYPFMPSVRRNVQHLLAQGIQLDLVCNDDGPAVSRVEQPGLHVYRIAVPHRRSALAYPLEYLRFFLRALPLICKLTWRQRYEVVQVDTLPDFLVFVAFLARWRGARVVLNMYELMPEMTAARLGLSPRHPLVRLVRWLEGRATAWADHVIAVSETCKRILVARGVPGDKVSVVPNTQPLPATLRPSVSRESFLVTHGTLVERYGVQVALHALAELQDAWPNITLLVLGGGEYQPTLVDLTDRLGLTARVIFRPWLSWQEGLETVSAATLGLVPVIADGYGELLLPTKLFDYVSLGIPAVCSRLTSIEEHFPVDALAYFSPGDASGLARCVDHLLRHPEEAHLQALRAKEALKRLAWENVSQHYLRALGAVS